MILQTFCIFLLGEKQGKMQGKTKEIDPEKRRT